MSLIFEKLKSPEFYSYIQFKIRILLSRVYYVGRVKDSKNYSNQKSWKLEKIKDLTQEVYLHLINLSDSNHKLYKRFSENDYDSLFEKYKNKFLKSNQGIKKLPNQELDAYLTTTILNFLKNEKNKDDVRTFSYIERIYKKVESLVLSKKYFVVSFLSDEIIPIKKYFYYNNDIVDKVNVKNKLKTFEWKYGLMEKIKKSDILLIEKETFNHLSKKKTVKVNKEIEEKIYRNDFLPDLKLEKYETDNDDWVKDISYDLHTNDEGNYDKASKNLLEQKYTLLLNNMIEKLGYKCQQLFHYFKAGKKNKEISELLQIPIGSVKSGLNNCKEKVRNLFKEEELSLNDYIDDIGYEKLRKSK